MPRDRVILAKSAVILSIATLLPAWGFPLSAQPLRAASRLLVEFDLPGYQAELDRCAQRVEQREGIAELRQSVPRVWRVKTAEGSFDVPTAWLTSELEKLQQQPVPDLSEAQKVSGRLRAMRKAAAEWDAESRQPKAAMNAREQLDNILRRREFSGDSGPSQLELLQARIRRWIDHQLFSLLSHLGIGARAGNVVSWSVVAIGFFSLCYWIARSLAARSGSPQPAAGAPDRRNNLREWVRDALAAAERGDYREAVHCAYWAAIVRLESEGILKGDRSRTPRESLRLLDPYPSEQRLLREFTQLFELIWYGCRSASADDWSHARNHLEKMGCLTPSTAATANS